MRKLKALLLLTSLAAGCALFVFGQQTDGKKIPPKVDPPIFQPKPKVETPRPTPTPKKPDED